jgi:acid phosphatase family membrane protein YuiD
VDWRYKIDFVTVIIKDTFLIFNHIYSKCYTNYCQSIILQAIVNILSTCKNGVPSIFMNGDMPGAHPSVRSGHTGLCTWRNFFGYGMGHGLHSTSVVVSTRSVVGVLI